MQRPEFASHLFTSPSTPPAVHMEAAEEQQTGVDLAADVIAGQVS